MKWHDPEDTTCWAYLEKSLSPGELVEYEKHLEDCSHCRLELEAARRMNGLTQVWQEEDPPAELAQSIRQSLAGPRRAIPLAGLAAAAALILSSLLLWRWLRPPERPAEPERPAPIALQSPGLSGETPGVRTLQTAHQWATHAAPKVFSLAGAVVTLGEHSRLELLREQGKTAHVRLLVGQVRIQEQHPSITVETRHFRAVPVGTEYSVTTTNSRSALRVYSGQVDLFEVGKDRPRRVAAGGLVTVPPIPPQKRPPVVRPQQPQPAPEPVQTPRLPDEDYPTSKSSPRPTPSPATTPLPETVVGPWTDSAEPGRQPWMRLPEGEVGHPQPGRPHPEMDAKARLHWRHRMQQQRLEQRRREQRRRNDRP